MIEFNPDLLFLLHGMTCTLAGGSRLKKEKLFFDCLNNAIIMGSDI